MGIQKMTERTFDIAIIGGGINGAGIALDAALRGLSVLLLEKGDFGNYTTSASTKLIHGGLRYLEYMEFPLVRESLRERERLLKNAPHLVMPLRLNVPIYKHSSRGPLMIKAGMILYDLLSFDKSLPSHTFKLKTGSGSLQQVEPSLKQEGLKAISSYYDCQVVYPERLCLEIVLSAKEAGAVVLNHHQVTGVKKLDDGLAELSVNNAAADENMLFRARIVINAAGPYVDQVCELVDSNNPRKMGGTKGSHIIIEQFEGGPREALYIEAIQDGRPFFIIPWREYYLVGTTDIYYDGDLDRVVATGKEIEYLLHELNHFIPGKNFNKEDVIYTYSGIRPLPYEPGKKESQVTRKHIIFDHRKEDPGNNMISIIGGKLTTYRSLAEECVDLVCGKTGSSEKCRTRQYPLYGARGITDLSHYEEDHVEPFARRYGISTDTVAYLIRFYGARFQDVLELADEDPSLLEKISDHHQDIKAQVVYAVRHELAQDLEDILVRRTGIGTSQCLGLDCVDKVAGLAGSCLGWNAEQTEKQAVRYIKKMQASHVPAYRLNQVKV